MDNKIKYNDMQLEAMKHRDGPLLIMAGAGSGKTRVLTGKIARLIEENVVDDSEILAFTFTNKAANEMKERISHLLGRDISHMWIGTFHSISSRILRMNIEKLGYTSDFTIYDTQDKKTLLKDVLKSLDMDKGDFNLNQLGSMISNYKNQGISPNNLYNKAITYQDKEICEIYETYEKVKKENNALDFDDLIVKALDLLKGETLAYYQSKFKYVFVDEYQDTNHSQYSLIKKLSGRYENLTVVGDQDQSIYGWRGADISNINNFEKDYPNAKVILLEQNYRSTKKILNLANQLIKNNIDRLEKNLWTDSVEGNDIVYKICQSETDEADQVVQWINQMSYREYEYGEMAILYRTNAQSRPFEERLMREGIKYKVVGGIKFYDRKEIKDLVAYLNLIVNNSDDLSLKRAINTPKRGIGDKSVEVLENFASNEGISMYEALDRDGLKSSAKFKDFKKMIESFKEKEQSIDVSNLVMDVYEETGMRKKFEESSLIEDKSRIENISSFINAVSEYEETEENASLSNYLQNISLMSAEDKTSDDKNSVTLMTMHQAKGLEFNCVYIVGLEDGLFPSRRTIEEGGLEEERRLFYVAITRAKKRLFLTSANTRRLYGTINYSKESRFIDEIKAYIKEEKPKEVKENILITNQKEEKRAQRKKYAENLFERKKVYEENKLNKYNAGDKIKHKKFGIGTIVRIIPGDDGDELTIAFDNKGIKNLNSRYRPLEVVDG